MRISPHWQLTKCYVVRLLSVTHFVGLAGGLVVGLISVTLLAGALLGRAFAQSENLVLKVIHSVSEAQQDGVALSVYFAVEDGNGRPLPRLNMESADIQLLSDVDSISPPVSASFFNPQTPIYIAVLIDTGGHLSDGMPFLKETAKAAIDQAPPNAALTVIPFNDVAIGQPLTSLSRFSTDHGLVKRDIDLVQYEPDTPTCINNALYEAIELLDGQVQNPQDRRAIILFTDGRDENQDGTPCSERNYGNVIDRAISNPNRSTPIFTFGLLEGETRVNREELIGIAEATHAYYAVGGRNDLNNSYRFVMDSLYNQVVAQALVYPHQGQNNAVLRLKVAESGAPLAATFTFTSDREYVKSAEPIPVDVRVNSIVPQSDNSYNVSLSLSNYEAIATLILLVNAKESNLQVAELPITPQGPTVVVPLDNAYLQGGQEYVIRVFAIGKDGQQITKRKDDLSAEVITVLAEASFRAQALPTPVPPKVTIESVSQLWDQNLFRINLVISPADAPLERYRVKIIEEETNADAYVSQLELFRPGLPIEVPIADTIRNSPAEHYIVSLDFELDGGDVLEEPVSIPITLRPPPPPSIWVRIWDLLYNETWLQITIGVIVLCSFSVLLISKLWTKKPKELAPLPVEYTHVPISSPIPKESKSGKSSAASKRATRLRVKLIQSPNQSQKLERVITSFPCEIGRHENSHVNLSTATTDKRISRHHVNITAEKDGLYLTDLGSDNGTFVNDKRLSPQERVQLKGTTLVRLGPETLLELRPES